MKKRLTITSFSICFKSEDFLLGRLLRTKNSQDRANQTLSTDIQFKHIIIMEVLLTMYFFKT